MQDAAHENAFCVHSIEDDVPTTLHATQTQTNFITRPAQLRIVGQHFAARFKIAEVANDLMLAPGTKGIVSDAKQICLGKSRESKEAHAIPFSLLL